MICPMCQGPSHPATGCAYTPTFVVCASCVRNGWKWIRQHVSGKGARKGLSFYDHVTFSGRKLVSLEILDLLNRSAIEQRDVPHMDHMVRMRWDGGSCHVWVDGTLIGVRSDLNEAGLMLVDHYAKA